MTTTDRRTALSQILSVLDRPEAAEPGWIAGCPLHADIARSLRITEHEGNVAVRCVTCRRAGDVAVAIERALGCGIAARVRENRLFAVAAA